MFDGHCAYCGVVLPEKGWHVDHVEAVYRKMKMVRTDEPFGTYKYVKTGEYFAPENDNLGNLMPSCGPCNIDKATSTIEDWRSGLERKVQVLRNNYSAWRHAERFGLVAQIESRVTFYFERVRAARESQETGA